MTEPSVAIVGAGAWGLALAAAAARAGAKPLVYSRRGRGEMPGGVQRTSDLADVAAARLVVLAIPSHVVGEVARELGDHVGSSHLVVHGVRGLVAEGDELQTVSAVVRRETPVRRVGALGGPALSEDLLAGRPAVLVCGSAYPEVVEASSAAFGCRTLRVYTTPDLCGLEWASALVGCLAIGIGYADQLGLGPGLSAALITRAIEEAARIASAAGGDERTLLGLAGYGDLLACIAQKDRPEVRLGAALARGQKLEEAVRAAELRVEAVELIPRVVAWAARAKVRAPILAALDSALFGRRSPGELIDELMTLDR